MSVRDILQAAAGVGGGEPTDPNFKQTVLLLHGDGNQGANNFSNPGPTKYLAFSDNSDNNFPITVQGDAYGDNFSPYAGNYSNYFDGNGDLLSVSSSTAFGFGTGDFTFEFWAYPTKSSGASVFFDTRTSNPQLAAQLYHDGTNIAYFFNGNSVIVANSALSLNAWQHIALVRNSSTTKMYVNGTQVGSSYPDSNSYVSSAPLRIGTYFGADQVFYQGYLSNFRVVKGRAVYTSAFTPPTSPLGATSGGQNPPQGTETSLLTCQSNRFVDNSSNNFTITSNGNVRVSPSQPFTLAANSNGSGYFDGTGNYLSLTNNAAFAFGTGNFTVEFWVYADSSSTTHGLVAPTQTGTYWSSLIFGGLIYWQTVNGTTNLFSYSYSGYYDKWTHVAFVRNSNTTKLYLDGVERASASDSTNYTLTAGDINIGRDLDNSALLKGHISNVRIVKGRAVYTSAFTPPTSPLGATSGGQNPPQGTETSLLTCQYNGTVRNVGFIDSSPNDYLITRVGNTTQGTFSPFSLAAGEWSNYFDGTSDWLSIPDSAALELGSSDFTIEAWVFQTVQGARNSIIAKGSSSATASTSSYYLEISSTNKATCYLSDGSNFTTIAGATSVVANTWNHIAVVRNGNTVKIYLNGVEDGSASFSSTVPNVSAQIAIGRPGEFTSLYFNGYISNCRLVVGRAVYTSAFTPPTSPLGATSGGQNPPQGTETSLLTCQSNRFVDNSTTPKTITRNGDVRVTPFSPFAPSAAYDPAVNGGSGYFDGTGDYLTAPQSLTDNSFTVEGWFYTDSTALQTLFCQAPNGSTTSETFSCYLLNGVFYIQWGSGSAFVTASFELGAWIYFAASYNQSTDAVTGYLNGSSIGAFSAAARSIGNYTTGIGHRNTTNLMLGYISNLRVVNGTALTISGVPTAPLTAITNTSLLLNFANAGILDQTGKNNLETVGNAQVDTAVKKYGLGSMKFDGSGDYLLIPPTDDLNLPGSFTIEFWVNFISTVSDVTFIAKAGINSQYAWFVQRNSGNLRVVIGNNGTLGPFRTYSWSPSTGQWYHVAISRDVSNLRVFIDGVQQGSTITETNNGTSNARVGIGVNPDQLIQPLNGYIDDLRITKGIARYTANFTPPAQAFPNL